MAWQPSISSSATGPGMPGSGHIHAQMMNGVMQQHLHASQQRRHLIRLQKFNPFKRAWHEASIAVRGFAAKVRTVCRCVRSGPRQQQLFYRAPESPCDRGEGLLSTLVGADVLPDPFLELMLADSHRPDKYAAHMTMLQMMGMVNTHPPELQGPHWVW